MTSFASQMRTLFAIILTSCFPSNPSGLWEKFKESMTEDILREVRREASNPELPFSSDMFNRVLIMLEDIPYFF